jgi:hypothetical protein
MQIDEKLQKLQMLQLQLGVLMQLLRPFLHPVQGRLAIGRSPRISTIPQNGTVRVTFW